MKYLLLFAPPKGWQLLREVYFWPKAEIQSDPLEQPTVN